MTDPRNRTTTWTYNHLDQVLTETDPSGVTTTHTYDSAGNPLTVSRPLLGAGGTTIATATTTFTYGDAGHPGDLTAVTDPLGRTITITYDSVGNIAAIREPATDAAPAGAVTRYTYNSIGWTTGVISPRGNLPGATAADFTTSYTHNAFGAVTSSTAPDSAVVSTTYDANNNVISSTDPNGNVTTTDYDLLDRPVTVHRADGTATTQTYTPTGQVASTVDAAGNATTYTYDSQDRVTSRTDPLGRTTTFAYDPAGNVTTSTQPGPVATTYGYDAADQLTSIDYPGGAIPDVRYTYDALGRRATRTDTAQTTWTYDSLGRLVNETVGAITTGYGYDLAGQLIAIDYPNGAGRIDRTYDPAGRLATVTDWHHRNFSFDYDADGNLIGQETPNGVTTDIDRDETGTITGINHAGAAGIAGDFAAFEYTRDANRQITGTSATGVPAGPTGFAYDRLNQLTTSTTGTSNPAYRYDRADNITRLLDETAQQFDAANQLVSSTAPITTVSATSLTDQAATQMVVPFTGGRAGDQVLLWVTTPASQSVTATPAGYTAIGTWTRGGTRAYLYRHAVTSIADATVTVNFSGTLGNYTKSATAVVYRGVDPTTPIDDLDAATSTGTSVTIPALDTTLDNSSEIIFTASHTASPTTLPGTWTVTGMTRQAAATPAIGVGAAAFDRHLIDAGSTGSRNATTTVSGDLIGVGVSLRPARVTYTYDARGNRTARTNTAGTTTYTYDAANRLTGVTGVASYTYDGDGLRTSKTVGSTVTNFRWSTNATLPLLFAENDTYYVYGPGNQIIEAIDPVPPIQFVGGTNLSVTNTPTLAVPMPAVQKRDFIILTTVIPAGQSATTPTGFVLVANTVSGANRTLIWTRVATDSEPATVNVSYSLAVYDKALAIQAWRNVDPLDPIEAHATTTATATNTITTGTGTASNQWGNQALIIAAGAFGNTRIGTGSWTTPAGTTQRGLAVNASSLEIAMADQAVPNGTVGPYNITAGSTGDLTAELIVLNHARPPGRYYHPDQLGSVRAITNEYAEVTGSRTYDPYGRSLESVGTSGFGHAGQYTDAETGFAFLRARYFDPATAQFMTLDPIVSMTGDPYGYALNNPVNATDPTGLCGFLGDGPCTPGGIVDDLADRSPVRGQTVANAAAGVLSGLTVGNQDLLLPASAEDNYDPNSMAFQRGRMGGIALLTPFAVTHPAALTWYTTGGTLLDVGRTCWGGASPVCLGTSSAAAVTQAAVMVVGNVPVVGPTLAAYTSLFGSMWDSSWFNSQYGC